MAESSEKVHKVHREFEIFSAKCSYDGKFLVKNTPAGKEIASVRSKPTEEKMKASGEDDQSPI
jgi:hypothetical protein